MAKKKKNTPQKKTPTRQSEQEFEQVSESESETESQHVPEPEENDDDFSFQVMRSFLFNILITSILGTVLSWFIFTRTIELLFHDIPPELRDVNVERYTLVAFYVLSMICWLAFEYHIRRRNMLYMLYRCMKYHCKRCRLWKGLVKMFSKEDPDDEPDQEKPIRKTKKLRPEPSPGMARLIGQRRRR